jgi:hypothetical protein
MKELFPALTAEIIAVGRAIGLTEEQLPSNAGELTVERSKELVKSGVKHIPSILLDVMNRRAIEVEGTLGYLVKKGKSHNVAVPVSTPRTRLPILTLTPFLRNLRSFTKSCLSTKSHSASLMRCEEIPVFQDCRVLSQ